MHNLVIEKTKTTPQVDFDATTGKLEIVGDNNPDVDGFVGSVNLIDFNGFTTFNPHLFKFTAPEGEVYIVDEKLGLQSMTDRNGNTLSITRDGIIHSSGKSVLFQRNATGMRLITVYTDIENTFKELDPLNYMNNFSFEKTSTFVSKNLFFLINNFYFQKKFFFQILEI